MPGIMESAAQATPMLDSWSLSAIYLSGTGAHAVGELSIRHRGSRRLAIYLSGTGAHAVGELSIRHRGSRRLASSLSGTGAHAGRQALYPALGLTQVGEVLAVALAVLADQFPRRGDARNQRVLRQCHAGQAGITADGSLDDAALVLLHLRDQRLRRSRERRDRERRQSASVHPGGYLHDVVRVEKTHAGTVTGVNDHIAG